MRTSATLFLISGIAAAAFGASCKSKPAEAPRATALAPSPAPPLPAPPPPKPACESLDEKCQALPETELLIAQTTALFRPPASWTYAKEPTLAVAFAPNADAALAFTAAPSAEPSAVLPAIETLLGRLKITNLKPSQLKARLKKPDSSVPGEGLVLNLWEIERKNTGLNPQLDGKGGSLLLVVASVGGQVVVGTGFVVKPGADAQASAIMTAVQSLRGSK
jgi:hypothetical protein